ncbi:MAG: TetR/AcrR family transcriptional regulator [Proteobacteria bacterium]|nr:TetR/AcrR family transcriptional regulator [Pseudomonadota bacterium]
MSAAAHYQQRLAREVAQRKERILCAARQLIARHGVSGVTMRDLADAANVSVPTLYNLFGNKETLLSAAIEDVVASCLRTAPESDGTGLKRVWAILGSCCGAALGQPSYTRSVLRAFLAPDDHTGLRESLAEELTAGLAAALAEMQARRQLAEWIDAREVAERVVSHAVSCFLAWASGAHDPERLRATIMRGSALILLGLARGRARTALETTLRDDRWTAL